MSQESGACAKNNVHNDLLGYRCSKLSLFSRALEGLAACSHQYSRVKACLISLSMDPAVTSEAISAGLPVRFGDASRSELLQSAHVNRTGALVITLGDDQNTENLRWAGLVVRVEEDLPVKKISHDTKLFQYPHSYIRRNLHVLNDVRTYVYKGATSEDQFLNIDHQARCRTADCTCWLDSDRLQLKLADKLRRWPEPLPNSKSALTSMSSKRPRTISFS